MKNDKQNEEFFAVTLRILCVSDCVVVDGRFYLIRNGNRANNLPLRDNFVPLACFLVESIIVIRSVGSVHFYHATPSVIRLDTLLVNLTMVVQVYNLQWPVLEAFCSWLGVKKRDTTLIDYNLATESSNA